MNYCPTDIYFKTSCNTKQVSKDSIHKNITSEKKFKTISIKDFIDIKSDYYLYDSHVHTKEVSFCGHVKAVEMVKLYKEAGYRGIVITDHYFDAFVENPAYNSWNEVIDKFLSGYRTAKNTGIKENLDVLLGMELRFDGSPEDFLVFGFDEGFLYENPYLNRLGLKSFKELIKDTDILIFQAHPFRPWLKLAPPELLDGVEVYNGNPRQNSGNDKAYAFGVENGLYMLSGSDSHLPEDVGLGGIAVPERLTTSSCLTRAITSDNSDIYLLQG